MTREQLMELITRLVDNAQNADLFTTEMTIILDEFDNLKNANEMLLSDNERLKNINFEKFISLTEKTDIQDDVEDETDEDDINEDEIISSIEL